MPPKRSKGKGAADGEEDYEVTLRRFKRSYRASCEQFDFPPEKDLVRRLNRYLEDGEDAFGNPVPVQFIFPYSAETPFGAPGARVAVNTLLSDGFHTRHLRHLCFYRAGLGDEGVDALVDVVKPRESALAALELVDCGVTPSGCTYLGIALKSNVSLRTLVLDFNAEIGDEGVANLTRHGLVANRGLECLSMRYCGIAVDGARSVAAEMLPHCSMPTLQLGGNMIGNDGALALGSALRENETLTNLDVSDCFFGDDPAVLEMFKDCLVENQVLNKINLTGNLFPEGAGEVLLDLIKTNTNLISLGTVGDLPTARVDPATFKACRKQVAVNKKNYLKRKKKKGKKGGKKGGKKKGAKK